jgi:ribose transport system ATP-binding protein
MAQGTPLLKIVDVHKSFSITKALKGVSLELEHGQILGLIGENGSGKSTLASVIAAVIQKDSGSVFFKGELFEPKNTIDAAEQGVCILLQEKGTFDYLSVANNIFAGKEALFSKNGILNLHAMNSAAQEALKTIHAEHIQTRVPVIELSFEDQKLVELARAMYSKPKVLLVDETSTALSRNGRSILYQMVREMKQSGNSVVFISHDIDEIMEVCDAVTILRDGNYIDTLHHEQFEESRIRSLMVGREMTGNYYRTDMESCKNSDVVFSMKKVFAKELSDISFQLHKGEILGFGGLAESGMHALGSIAAGYKKPDMGTVESKDGRKISNPLQAIAKSIIYMSKNRDSESLMVSSSITDNICLPSYQKLRKGPFIWPGGEKCFVKKLADELEIKMRDMNQYVLELSGGNKQKVALAKWIGFGAHIFIMDCPTRGIDVGVKANIYKLMMDLRNKGKSIILISEELSEVIGMSDRVIILKKGRINGEFVRESAITENLLIDYMI